MDLIYTNASREDVGILLAYELDLSFGDKENDFQLIIGRDSDFIDYNALLYIEGTEYGGIVDTMKTNSNGDTVTYSGRTWHGILNSKVIEPDVGEDYLIVSGEANVLLGALLSRLGLTDLFSAEESDSGISISKYQFYRYCTAYEGLRGMLAAANAKLHIEVKDKQVYLSAVPDTDYTNSPEDNDTAGLKVERCKNKVNHLICLGAGELAERQVIHLYADKSGNIGKTQYYTGIEEVTDVYELAVSDDLEYDGITRLKALRDVDTVDLSLKNTDQQHYDIGDIVGATEIKTGISVTGRVTQKIIKIKNGAINIEYTAGGC